MYNKILSACVITLLIAFGTTLYCNNKQVGDLKIQLNEAQGRGSVSFDVSLPDLEKYFHTFEESMLSYVNRETPDSLVGFQEYVPPEGSIEVHIVQDTSTINKLEAALRAIRKLELEGTQIDTLMIDSLRTVIDSLYLHVYTIDTVVGNKGFCFVPIIGVDYSSTKRVQLSTGARLLYFSRFGAGVSIGLSPFNFNSEDKGLNPSVNAFINYRTPGLQNVAPRVSGGYIIGEGWYGSIGIDFLLK